MKMTLDQIDRTINNLGRLMPAKPNKNLTREYSLKESIFLMAPKLLEMRDMGFTGKELVAALADEEIVIKGATLNHYLCEYQKQSQDKTESGPATEADPEQISSTKPNPAVGENPKPTTEPESVSSTAAKSERATTWDKSSVTDQSANRPMSSAWQSEKGGGDD